MEAPVITALGKLGIAWARPVWTTEESLSHKTNNKRRMLECGWLVGVPLACLRVQYPTSHKLGVTCNSRTGEVDEGGPESSFSLATY